MPRTTRSTWPVGTKERPSGPSTSSVPRIPNRMPPWSVSSPPFVGTPRAYRVPTWTFSVQHDGKVLDLQLPVRRVVDDQLRVMAPVNAWKGRPTERARSSRRWRSVNWPTSAIAAVTRSRTGCVRGRRHSALQGGEDEIIRDAGSAQMHLRELRIPLHGTSGEISSLPALRCGSSAAPWSYHRAHWWYHRVPPGVVPET